MGWWCMVGVGTGDGIAGGGAATTRVTLAVGKGWWCIDWVTVVEGRHIWDVARILGG